MGGWEPEPSGGSSRRRHRGAGGRNDHPPQREAKPPGRGYRPQSRAANQGEGQRSEPEGEAAQQPDNRAEPRTHALPPGDLKQRRPQGRRHHSGLPSTSRNRRAGNKAPAKYGAAGASRQNQAPKAKELTTRAAPSGRCCTIEGKGGLRLCPSAVPAPLTASRELPGLLCWQQSRSV